MAKTVVMPQMGYDMDAGTLLRWLKQEGDPVERGEAIAEIETDKVNIEIEAFEEGVLRKFLISEGQTVPVGEAIAIIGTADEPIDAETAPASAPADGKAAAPETVAVAAEAPVVAAQMGAAQEGEAPPLRLQEQMETQTSAPVPVDGGAQPAAPTEHDGAALQATAAARDTGERIRASPLVRRIAAEHDIDLSQVQGTGPHGRIVKRDIEPFMTGARPLPRAAERPAAAVPAAPAAPAAPVAPSEAPAPTPVAPAPAPAGAPGALGAPGAPGELRDLSRIRQTIGKRLGQSWMQAPHFYVTMDVDMTAAMEMRAQVNEGRDRATELTINDLIIKGAALTLRQFPNLNAAWEDGKLRVHDRIDINNAVALEGGLISPFIPEADTKSLGEISRIMKDQARRAREGGLKPEEYQGGTFTISNIGMFGVDSFIAVINPPQAAILAVGGVQTSPQWDEDAGRFEPKQMMKITLSADHRVTDGAEVARFLQTLKRLLESPMELLVG
jgi:pyruvate dehydrogenase E2 component (dihydrolipoamide acetyltransferase)